MTQIFKYGFGPGCLLMKKITLALIVLVLVQLVSASHSTSSSGGSEGGDAYGESLDSSPSTGLAASSPEVTPRLLGEQNSINMVVDDALPTHRVNKVPKVVNDPRPSEAPIGEHDYLLVIVIAFGLASIGSVSYVLARSRRESHEKN